MATRGRPDSVSHISKAKPYERPDGQARAKRREEKEDDQHAGLLGGLFKKARSLFGIAPPPSAPAHPSNGLLNGSVDLTVPSNPPASASASRQSRPLTRRPPAASTSTPLAGRTSARGTTPIATLHISPEKADQTHPNTSSSVFALPASANRRRTETPFKSPSLTALRLRSPSPDKSSSTLLRPGSSIFSDAHPSSFSSRAPQRSFSPYKRPLDGSPPPKHSQNDSFASMTMPTSSSRGLQRSASVTSFASSANTVAGHPRRHHYDSTATPRKRQMLWDPAHGFVAASQSNDLDPSARAGPPLNEAERILSQLESMSGLHQHKSGTSGGGVSGCENKQTSVTTVLT